MVDGCFIERGRGLTAAFCLRLALLADGSLRLTCATVKILGSCRTAAQKVWPVGEKSTLSAVAGAQARNREQG